MVCVEVDDAHGGVLKVEIAGWRERHDTNRNGVAIRQGPAERIRGTATKPIGRPCGSATCVFVLGWEEPKNHTNRVALRFVSPDNALKAVRACY